MKKKIWFPIAFALIVTTLALVITSNNQFIDQPEFVTEATHPTLSSHGNYERLFKNVEEIYQFSDLVAEITVTDQESLEGDVPTAVQTRSTVQVNKVYKGSPDLKSIVITESGGVTDLSKIKKSFDTSNQNQGLVEITPEGSPVIKPQNTYLVFLKDTKDAYWGYTISGSIQGKIRLNESNMKGVITVQKDEYEKSKDLFFLQRDYAGKDKTDLESKLSKLKQ